MLSYYKVLVLACVLLSMNSYAQFEVNNVTTSFDEGLLQVNTDATLSLPDEIQKALDNGIDLRILFEIRLDESNDWWLDDTIDSWEMLFTLHFHQLSGRYILATPLTDEIQTFNTALQALVGLQTQLVFNLGYLENINSSVDYHLMTRLRLDKEDLPGPLRLFSIIARDWNLDSGWKKWQLGQ